LKRRDFLGVPLLLIAHRAEAAGEYPPVEPGHALRFPRDHGSHPDFRVEWWYVTGWLADGAGNDYGVQVTFFRNRPRIAEDNRARAPRQLRARRACRSVELPAARPAAARRFHSLKQARTRPALSSTAGRRPRRRHHRASVAARGFALDLAFASALSVLERRRRLPEGPLPQQASLLQSISLPSRTIGVDGDLADGHAWPITTSSEVMAPEAAGWDWAGINPPMAVR
jgi:predicted secreted hydrolase